MAGAAEASGEGVCWVGGSGPGRKRIRLNRKTHAHIAGILGTQSRPRVWKRLSYDGHSVFSLADCKRRRSDQQDEEVCAWSPQDRGRVIPEAAQAHVSGFAC